jgi:hypothetical protein
MELLDRPTVRFPDGEPEPTMADIERLHTLAQACVQAAHASRKLR